MYKLIWNAGPNGEDTGEQDFETLQEARDFRDTKVAKWFVGHFEIWHDGNLIEEMNLS